MSKVTGGEDSRPPWSKTPWVFKANAMGHLPSSHFNSTWKQVGGGGNGLQENSCGQRKGNMSEGDLKLGWCLTCSPRMGCHPFLSACTSSSTSSISECDFDHDLAGLQWAQGWAKVCRKTWVGQIPWVEPTSRQLGSSHRGQQTL